MQELVRRLAYCKEPYRKLMKFFLSVQIGITFRNSSHPSSLVLLTRLLDCLFIVFSSQLAFLFIVTCSVQRWQYCFHHCQNSVNSITHEPLDLPWWNFGWTCTLTTSRTLLNIKVIGQRSRSHGFFVCFMCAWYCLNQLACICEMSFTRLHHY